MDRKHRLTKVELVKTKTKTRTSSYQRSSLEEINIFPNTTGFFYVIGELIEIFRDRSWVSEFLKKLYYTRIFNNSQVLLLVDQNIHPVDIRKRSKEFWSSLAAFILVDQVYVVERKKIGIFPFRRENVIPYITFREYDVPGFRHCRLVTVDEAKEILESRSPYPCLLPPKLPRSHLMNL